MGGGLASGLPGRQKATILGWPQAKKAERSDASSACGRSIFKPAHGHSPKASEWRAFRPFIHRLAFAAG
jgi:hypothetical protein